MSDTRAEIAPLDPLSGSIVPLITPFTDGEIDLATYESLVARQMDAGSHGVLVTGTTGEPSTLTIAERARLVEVAVKTSGGRIPVVAATGSQSLAETLELTALAESKGADAVLVVTPYYIKPPQEGLVAYLSEVARSTSLPTMIYHIPGRAGVTMEPWAVEKLASQAGNVVGMKHASADIAYIASVLDRLDDFRIFSGLEELGFPMMTLGAVGVMNAVGNIAPAKVAEMCTAVFAGDLLRARQIHMELLEINRAVFWETNPIPMKYLMRRMGLLEANEHRLPMLPAEPALEQRLDDLLERHAWLR